MITAVGLGMMWAGLAEIYAPAARIVVGGIVAAVGLLAVDVNPKKP